MPLDCANTLVGHVWQHSFVNGFSSHLTSFMVNHSDLTIGSLLNWSAYLLLDEENLLTQLGSNGKKYCSNLLWDRKAM